VSVALQGDESVHRSLLTADSVKEAYTSVNFARRLVTVAQQSLDRAELNLRSAQGFYETGTQPRSAVTLAEVDVGPGLFMNGRHAGRPGRWGPVDPFP
jgi:outer membrane protein TolC